MAFAAEALLGRCVVDLLAPAAALPNRYTSGATAGPVPAGAKPAADRSTVLHQVVAAMQAAGIRAEIAPAGAIGEASGRPGSDAVDILISADAVVAGSGAGGSVAAAALAEGGARLF